jgi:adenylate kinase family enzyme
MKINIIGPSCVGKTTLSSVVAKKNNWPHFDLDLEFIDADYLAQTKIFRYREKEAINKRIKRIIKDNKDWIIEGVYAVDNVFNAADIIILIKLPFYIPLQWQWKRFCTSKFQRDTYGFLNNLGLTRDIFNQYLSGFSDKNINDPTFNNIKKYVKVLKKYKGKLKEVTNVVDLEELERKGTYHHL